MHPYNINQKYYIPSPPKTQHFSGISQPIQTFQPQSLEFHQTFYNKYQYSKDFEYYRGNGPNELVKQLEKELFSITYVPRVKKAYDQPVKNPSETYNKSAENLASFFPNQRGLKSGSMTRGVPGKMSRGRRQSSEGINEKEVNQEREEREKNIYLKREFIEGHINRDRNRSPEVISIESSDREEGVQSDVSMDDENVA